MNLTGLVLGGIEVDTTNVKLQRIMLIELSQFNLCSNISEKCLYIIYY